MSGRRKLFFVAGEVTPYLMSGLDELQKTHDVWTIQLHPRECHDFDYAQIHKSRVVIPSVEKRQLLDSLREQITRIKPEVVIVCGWGSRYLRGVFRILRRRGIPAVLLTDTPVGHISPFSPKFIAHRLFVRRYVDAVFVPGELSRRYMASVGAKRIFTGGYCHEVRSMSSVSCVAPDPRANFRLLFVGRISWEKNLRTLLLAFAAVKERLGQKPELFILGSGPQDADMRQFGSDAAFFEGFVQPDKITSYFANSHALVMPSVFDPWPLAILEACSYGLPVVASAACGSVELLRNHVTSVVFDPLNQRQLQDALVECFDMVSTEDNRSVIRGLAQGLAAPYDQAFWPRRVEAILKAIGV